MQGVRNSIFRQKALNAYLENRQKVILPRLATPRMFAYLWGMLGLLLLGGMLLAMARVPVYVQGTGLFVESLPPSQESSGLILVSLIPPQHQSALEAGQLIRAELGARRPLIARIASIEPVLRQPEALRERLGLREEFPLAATRPVTVAIAKLEHVPEEIPPSSLAGSSSPIEVRVGSRRVLSFLPGF